MPSLSKTTHFSGFNLAIESTQLAVRNALTTLFKWLEAYPIAIEELDSIETVLAEVLNNVEEHAYCDTSDGKIELSVEMKNGRLNFSICDSGHSMPQGELPTGKRAVLDCKFEDLPEGGFGWFLIRNLTEDLVYKRLNHKNQLSFVIPLGQSYPMKR